MNIFLNLQSEFIDTGAADTLRELSPWAYVIVLFSLAITAIFLRLYIKEKEEKTELEKEFRVFMADSLTKQIGVSKDVIELVTNNKNEIKDALSTFNSSNIKVENLLTEIRNQLTRIEDFLNKLNLK